MAVAQSTLIIPNDPSSAFSLTNQRLNISASLHMTRSSSLSAAALPRLTLNCRVRRSKIMTWAMAESNDEKSSSKKVFKGECFVLPDNIDTDQIIPAEHLTLVPSKPDEYEKLGSLALCGLPSIHGKFVEEGEMKTKYKVIIAGANFGCGSSREHAPVALGASGLKAVVAESYARIFFRNSVATGELYPIESERKITNECKTGDIVTLDIEKCVLINHTQNKTFQLKPLGDAEPVIDAGGLFEFARKSGMIAHKKEVVLQK